MSNHLKTLLVGAGWMADAYGEVLQALGQPWCVLTRGPVGAARMRERHGVDVTSGGLEAFQGWEEIGSAIVAVNVEELSKATDFVLSKRVGRILVEKPGGLYISELERLLERHDCQEVFVAYNRRFNSSTRAVREFLEEDGGVTSFQFEFSELSDRVLAAGQPENVLSAWFFCNSTHVLDLAFFLGGEPEVIDCHRAGSLHWHSSGARFVGAGTTAQGVPFSYSADWTAPGRWGVELKTVKRRFVLRPLEQLWVQEAGSFDLRQCELDDAIDREFKPGLYHQTKAFLAEGPSEELLALEEHLNRVRNVFQKICPIS